MVDFLTFGKLMLATTGTEVALSQRQNKFFSHCSSKLMVSKRHNYSYSHKLAIATLLSVLLLIIYPHSVPNFCVPISRTLNSSTSVNKRYFLSNSSSNSARRFILLSNCRRCSSTSR